MRLAPNTDCPCETADQRVARKLKKGGVCEGLLGASGFTLVGGPEQPCANPVCQCPGEKLNAAARPVAMNGQVKEKMTSSHRMR